MNISFEPLDRNQLVLGGKVGVAHGHLDSFMPHQFGDGADIHIRHDEAAGERVPEIVPGKICDACLLDRIVKPVTRALQWFSTSTQENWTLRHNWDWPFSDDPLAEPLEG